MPHTLPLHACLFALLALLPALARAQPTTTVTTDAELRAALRSATPGATIRLAPGTYRGGLYVEALRDVTITGDPDKPTVIRGGNNGVHFTRCTGLTVEHLTIEDTRDNGLNIDEGGPDQPPAADITLRRVTVRNVGPRGNHDGIKLSGLRRFRLEDCRVERWGDGGSAIDMVGCHDGVITRCTLDGTGRPASTGIQAKGGSANVRITACLFLDAGARAVNLGGSTGEPFFRPPLRRAGNTEARDITVTGCVFVGSEAPVAFTTSAHCSVAGNLIVAPRRWVFRLLQEQPTDRFLASGDHALTANVILFPPDPRRLSNVGPDTRPDTLHTTGNLFPLNARR